MLGLIILLFSITVILYAFLGVYVLNKNPSDHSNQIFAILMLVFIFWSVGAYNINLIASGVPPTEIFPALKIQFSGTILALAAFVILSTPNKKKAAKNPMLLLICVLSLYNVYLIWTTDIMNLGVDALTMISGNLENYFLFSSVFGIAGVYLLHRYYMKSKYMQPDQAKYITAGAILSILFTVAANIILPMLFDIYLIGLTTFAPVVMGIFFAYAVYQYGFIIRPAPELSPTSFCGVNCMACVEYANEKCKGCRFEIKRYINCEIHNCLLKKEYSWCGNCPELINCMKRKDTTSSCFVRQPKLVPHPGTFLVENNGYEILIDSMKMGAPGIVVTEELPSKARQDHGLKTTSIVWISDHPEGIAPKKLERLGLMLANSMKNLEAAGGGVVLLDGLKELIEVNGRDKVLDFIIILDSAARAHNITLLIARAGVEFEEMLKVRIKYLKL